MTMTTSVALRKYTPETAQQFMERTKNCRKLIPAHVAYLADQITNGHWVVNGETIKFDAEGHLTDGQHRLAACIKAQRPIESWTVWGSDATGVDEGKPRQLAHLLAGRNISDANSLAATLRILYLINQGVDCFRPERINNTKMLQFSESIDWDRMRQAQRVAYTDLAVKSIWVVVAYTAMAETKMEKVQAFFRAVNSGENLQANSPTLHLRNWLISTRKKRATASMRRSMLVATIRAWNMFKHDKPCFPNTIWARIHDGPVPKIL